MGVGKMPIDLIAQGCLKSLICEYTIFVKDIKVKYSKMWYDYEKNIGSRLFHCSEWLGGAASLMDQLEKSREKERNNCISKEKVGVNSYSMKQVGAETRKLTDISKFMYLREGSFSPGNINVKKWNCC